MIGQGKFRPWICCAALVAAMLPFGSVTRAYALPVPDEEKIPAMVALSIWDETTMGFNWNTSDYTGCDVEVAPYGSGFTGAEVMRFTGSVALSRAHEDDGYIHRAVAAGLKAGTKYSYRLGDAEFDVWAEGSFTTPKTDGAFEFVHLSDPQGWTESHYYTYSGLLSAALTDSPAFIAATGDIVNNSWAEREPVLQQWDWALTKQFPYLKDVPFMAVAGNHDAADYDFSSRFYYDVGGDERTGNYYSFNYSDAHFIALNTNDTIGKETPEATGLSEAQMSWLKADLEANKAAEWKIVMMHKGIFDSGSHSSNVDLEDYDIAKIRGQLAPLFAEYGVDLVLQGHDHLYSLSYPVSAELADNALKVIPDKTDAKKASYEGRTYSMSYQPEGAVYFNTGSASGSKYYEIQPYNTALIPIADTSAPKSPMFTRIRIDGGCLLADTYLVENGDAEAYKSFGIYKGEPEEGTLKFEGGEKPSDNSSEALSPKSSAWKIVLIAVVGGIVLIGTGIGALWIFRKKKP